MRRCQSTGLVFDSSFHIELDLLTVPIRAIHKNVLQPESATLSQFEWKIRREVKAACAGGKKPGYPKWQKFIPSRDELLTAIYEKQKMWGCVCGSVSGNLQIVDYDLYKILDSKEKAIQWRKENIGLLRSLDTLVTFTPRGGFHVWLRTRRPGLQTRAISRVVEAIPWDIDLVRGDGGMVVVPPSKIKDAGNYWFLDDTK